jgi:hypothetical protein
MAYVPKNEGGDFQMAPPGTWPAICYRVIDLGTQRSTWNNNEKFSHKIMVTWEIADPEQHMADGRPFSVSQRYTWSMFDRAILRQHLESWRGVPFTDKDLSGGPGGFQIERIIGQPCLLTILHEKSGDKTYANIKSVVKMPKGMPIAAQANPSQFLWLTSEEYDPVVFSGLHEKLQEVIMKSPEYQELSGVRAIPDTGGGWGENQGDKDDLDDEIPF